eukprot:TRINITY_DN718_c0_g2_i1.p1 TRINITY_DN718_c0_g2~~TRINITY_DN718_c0_g2_i1.p1  ORF type:complete len:446 (-),score=72.12 TRINITY_DN718_c0_g2_i1:215-1552(-)
MCSCDWDEWFSYPTYKVVQVRDRYLGLMHYAFTLAILVYIVVFNVLLQQAFFEYDSVIGTISMSLKKPSSLTRTADYSYCRQHAGPPDDRVKWGENETLCEVWDPFDIVYPSDLGTEMFITTRVTRTIDHLACQQNDSCQDVYVSSSPSTVFIAGIEEYTMRVTHAAYASKFYFDDKDGTHLDQLYGTSNTMKGHFGEDVIDVHQDDIFSIGKIINATKYDLFQPAQTNETAWYLDEVTESLRHSGAVIMVDIRYSNVPPAPQIKIEPLSYKYNVFYIEGTEAKVMETRYLNETTRLLNNRHGLRLLFNQSGNIARLSFVVLLINLTAALGLLGVSVLIVDFVMLYLMPLRNVYGKHKFEKTAERTQMREQHNADEQNKHGELDEHNADTEANLAALRVQTMEGLLANEASSCAVSTELGSSSSSSASTSSVITSINNNVSAISN